MLFERAGLWTDAAEVAYKIGDGPKLMELRLKCAPSFEASVYRNDSGARVASRLRTCVCGPAGVHLAVGEDSHWLDAVAVANGQSDTCAYYRWLGEQFGPKGAAVEEMPGCGHLMVMEEPRKVAELVAAMAVRLRTQQSLDTTVLNSKL